MYVIVPFVVVADTAAAVSAFDFLIVVCYCFLLLSVAVVVVVERWHSVHTGVRTKLKTKCSPCAASGMPLNRIQSIVDLI